MRIAAIAAMTVVLATPGPVRRGRRVEPTHALKEEQGRPGSESGRPRGADTPGAGSGASGNQKNASESPPPQSKKKCWPIPAGSSIVLMSGMPRTFV